LEQQSQRLDHWELCLKNQIQKQLLAYRNQLHQLQLRQQVQHPQRRLEQLRERLHSNTNRLVRAQQQLLNEKQQRFGETTRLLNTLSPLNTLERGYALVTDASTQTIITRSDQVKPGSRLYTRLAKGELLTVVEKIKAD
jgi:exodeoxyribonuclease VII large subunit